MIAARHTPVAFLFLLLACVAPESTPKNASTSASTDSTRFDLVTSLDQPVVIHANGVELQPDARALVVNFPNIQFARASSEAREITLSTLYVRVTHPDHPEADKDGDA